MTQIDVLQLVKEGLARYEWTTVTSKHGELQLRIAVLADAMKFDGMPELNWHREPRSDFATPSPGETYDGVRLPVTAEELQQIGDLVGASLLTPRVIDLIWLQASVKFDANINTGPPSYDIAATMDITHLHGLIEADIERVGGSGLVSCVGKYWCLTNVLEQKGMVEGDWAACNYGWFQVAAPSNGVTPGTKLWQTRGYRHNKVHIDPSQTIRLMGNWPELSRDGGETWEHVFMSDVMADPELAPLITADGKPLTYTRQNGVEEQPASPPLVQGPVAARGDSDPKVEATS